MKKQKITVKMQEIAAALLGSYIADTWHEATEETVNNFYKSNFDGFDSLDKRNGTVGEVFSDILTRYRAHFSKGVSVEASSAFYNDVYTHYQLCDDPFTGFPCSCEEYAKNWLQRQRETMMERYGHYDGLD